MHLALLSLFSAILLIFSFPTPSVAFLAWFALVPLFFLSQEAKNWRQLFLYSYFAGLVFWGGLVYWVCFVTYTGFIFMILYLALYFPAFVLLLRFLRRRSGLSFVWSAPVVWTALEYLRTYLLTGFPWGLLGSTQYSFLPLIQIAEWTGVYGVSFLVVMGNAWLFEVIYSVRQKREHLKMTEAALPLVILTAAFFYGGTFFAYPERKAEQSELVSTTDVEIFMPTPSPKKKVDEKTIRVAVIQGNIPQDIKLDNEFEGFIRDEYGRLTRDEVKKEKLDIVIWPETAIPTYVRYDVDSIRFFSDLMRDIQTPLLFGSSDAKKIDPAQEFTPSNRAYSNAAFLLMPGKEFDQHYNKIHLVPFGEYVPWIRWLPFLRKATPIEDVYTPSREYTVFNFALPFSVVICFEDVFPNLVRQFVKSGAQWLVNLTNDGWFRNSTAPMQHAVLALFRCVENRVWMVRSTNTGVSCFIDPTGRITRQVEDAHGKNIWLQGTASETIHPGPKITFYTRHGDVFSWINIVLAVTFLFFRRRKD